MEEANTNVVDYCVPVQTINKGSCLDALKIMEDWLIGSYIAMKSTLIVPGSRTIIDIVCKYNSLKVIPFVLLFNLHFLLFR